MERVESVSYTHLDTVDVPSSKMKLAIAQILLDEGYIKKYDILDDGAFKTIHILSLIHISPLKCKSSTTINDEEKEKKSWELRHITHIHLPEEI